MAGNLKVESITVPEWGGRDAGKTFVIREMPALRAEKWAWRMAIALKGTAGYIPLDVEESLARLGMVGVAIRGINAFLAAAVKFDELEPLLDEMLRCVTIVRDPRHPDVASAIIEADICEPKTVMWLRGEVLRVHTGFTAAEVLSKLASAIRSPDSSTT